jgi:hypothetical protein
VLAALFVPAVFTALLFATSWVEDRLDGSGSSASAERVDAG